MCDYSLDAVKTREARVGETLVVTEFRSGGGRGFAGTDDCTTAVCLKPGTELSLGTFRQVNKEFPNQHHDGLLAADGSFTLLVHLKLRQQATVLQLPAEVRQLVAA
jgi:hypothetical protein